MQSKRTKSRAITQMLQRRIGSRKGSSSKPGGATEIPKLDRRPLGGGTKVHHRRENHCQSVFSARSILMTERHGPLIKYFFFPNDFSLMLSDAGYREKWVFRWVLRFVYINI